MYIALLIVARSALLIFSLFQGEGFKICRKPQIFYYNNGNSHYTSPDIGVLNRGIHHCEVGELYSVSWLTGTIAVITASGSPLKKTWFLRLSKSHTYTVSAQS